VGRLEELGNPHEYEYEFQNRAVFNYPHSPPPPPPLNYHLEIPELLRGQSSLMEKPTMRSTYDNSGHYPSPRPLFKDTVLEDGLASSFYWAQLSRFHMKTERESIILHINTKPNTNLYPASHKSYILSTDQNKTFT
jgi:hypothetical protein